MLATSHPRYRYRFDLHWLEDYGLVRLFRRIYRTITELARPTRHTPPPFQHDLIAWANHFLPHHFQKPPSKMHQEVAAILDAESSRHTPCAVAVANAPTEQSQELQSPPGWHWQAQSASAELQADPPLQDPSQPHTGRLRLPVPPDMPLTRSPLHPFTRSSSPTPHFTRHPDTSPPDTPLRLNLLAPRGSAKSTLVTLAHVLHEALEGRQPYIWIVSDTKHQAISHLENIRAELEDNDALHHAYPHAAHSITRAGRITLANVQIEAFGAGQRLRGKRFRQYRPSLIVCDDLQNDGHISSARQRDRSRNWFHSMLLKAGTKHTSVINLGTALHREALAMELHTAPGWTSRRFQAIQQWPTNMQLWAQWEELYRQEPGVGGQESDGWHWQAQSASAEPQTDLPSQNRSQPHTGRRCLPVPPDMPLTRSPSVVRGSPDPAPAADRRSPDAEQRANPGDLRSAPWHGRETEPQQVSATNDAAPRVPLLACPAVPHQANSNTAGQASSGTQPEPTAPLTRSPLHPFTRSSPHPAADDFYHTHHDQLQAGSALLWPEEEDLYTLMQMRADSGSAAFEREKQCVPLNPEECEWPEAYFDGDIWFSAWPSDLRLKTLALDPSKGTDAKHGDYSAFVMLGIANDGTLYVEANLARRPTPQIVTDGVELIKFFQPQLFGIETNQFQALLGNEFGRELTRQKIFTTSPCSIDNYLPKLVRIRRLGPFLANHKLKFKQNSPGTNMLLSQLREFPLAQHNDGPDALEMALRLAEKLNQPIPNDGLGNRLIQ